MKWIEPPEKGSALKELEDRLWKAADQLRANSNLTAGQYSQPVLGLIFLRFADTRFMAQRAKLDKAASSGRRAVPSIDDPRAYQAAGVLYLNKKARFDHLLSSPETAALGEAINEAMRLIEKDNSNLKGVLPQTYQVFETRTLVERLRLIASIPLDLEGDVFGKIYEYFLGAFAMAEGQLGGEFFTLEIGRPSQTRNSTALSRRPPGRDLKYRAGAIRAACVGSPIEISVAGLHQRRVL